MLTQAFAQETPMTSFRATEWLQKLRRAVATLALTALCALSLAAPSHAQPIPGAQDAAYIAARDQWLQGDDLAALQALSALANAENSAAQMLLSQIAGDVHTHQHLTADMPRRERIALLRQTVGISGRDWMQSAATMHPLAQVYWASRSPERDAMVAAQRLLRLGIVAEDRRTAFYEIAELLYAGEWEEAEASAHALRPYLGIAADVLLANALSAQRPGLVRVPAGITTNAQFDAYLAELASPQARIEAEGLLGVIPYREVESNTATAAALVEQSSGLQPLVAFCADNCGGSQPGCLVSAAIAISRSANGYLPFASPLPVLISDADYQNSARFSADIRALLAAGDWPGCTPQ